MPYALGAVLVLLYAVGWAIYRAWKTDNILHEVMLETAKTTSMVFIILIGAAMLTVLAFFAIKTLASAMGGNGYLLTPWMAAWIPLLVLGPVAYVRLRDVQLV